MHVLDLWRKDGDQSTVQGDSTVKLFYGYQYANQQIWKPGNRFGERVYKKVDIDLFNL
jgi:hypothetical protein